MDILFIATSNYNDPFAQEWHPDLRYTVSFLRSHNINAGFIYLPVLESPSQIVQIIGGAKPGAVFFNLTEENRSPVLSFLKLFKAAFPATCIIVGGIPATLSSTDLMNRHREIDFIVTGEPELTLLETLEALSQKRIPAAVNGLQSRSFQNPPRPLITDLDMFGSMIYDGLDEFLTGKAPEDRVGYILSGRGCYANCSFCGIPAFYRHSSGSPWRGRSVKAIVGELEELMGKFDIRYFVFQDDNFMGPGPAGQERAREIAAEILSRGLEIKYHICCRLNDINADTIELLKESGLSRLAVSVESTSQESLNLLGKGIRAENIYSTLEDLERLQLPTEINLIFFDPYTTLASVRRNLALLEYLNGKQYLFYSNAFPFNELKPFPWSRVAARLRSEGLLDEETFTCRFRDPCVEQLVVFVQRLKRHIPFIFKKRFVFSGLNSPSQNMPDKSVEEGLNYLSVNIKNWVGLKLMPGFLENACSILENGGNSVQEELLELDSLFREEIRTVREMEHRLYKALQRTEI